MIKCPKGQKFLPYQIEGIRFALKKKGTLIADEMGLGKTIQAIGVINARRSIKRVLVVCPNTLKTNWRRELKRWLTRQHRILVVNARKKIHSLVRYNVIIINYDIVHKMRRLIDKLKWDLLIIDEAHFVKSRKARRTKAIFGGAVRYREKGQKKTARTVLKPIKARKRLFLTGTPILNRPIDLWPIVKALDPTGLGRSLTMYALRYCDAQRDRWGMKFTGAKNLDELHTLLTQKFMIRRLKKDVLTDLPPKRRQIIELPIPTDKASRLVATEIKIYESHEEYIQKLLSRIRTAKKKGDVGTLAELRRALQQARAVQFSEISRVRHQVGLAKVPMVTEHLRLCLEAGPAVCFAHHRDVIEEYRRQFKNDCVILTGDTKPIDRQRAVDRFQDGKARLFVGNYLAAGTGITLTRSSYVAFAELDWVPAVLTQAEDRVHRIGQLESVLVQHLVLEGSLDAQISRTLVKKQEIIDQAIDGIAQ